MSNVVLEYQAELTELKLSREAARRAATLQNDGGGGTYDGMDGRVSALEAHMEHMREDMREVKADLKFIVEHVRQLPTRRDLDTWRWQWLATGVGIIALTVGGITGGLALIARFAG